MFYDPRTQEHGLPHNPWTAVVTPRPIGWISTRSADGTPNLAPYSFFNAVSGQPPFVMFASASRKDSQTNAEATGEFVVNIATWQLRQAMNQTSAAYAADIDEFAVAGLEAVPGTNVAVPRVGQSPIAIECRHNKTVTLVAANGQVAASSVIIGEVVGIHIDDRVLVEGRVDVGKVQPLARFGYMDYSVTTETFAMIRPTVPE